MKPALPNAVSQPAQRIPTAAPPTGTDAPLCPPSSAHWQDGWLHGHVGAGAVVHQPSPNFGPRPATACIDLAVLHSISLPPGQYGTGCVQQLFANQLDWQAHPYFEGIRGLEVSAHFFITRSAQVWQFVSADARAWHAGASCWRGRSNCNDDSIGIELEGLEGETFEPLQYQALSALLQLLAAQYPLVHLAGHEHIAPGRKHDPGAGFDWLQLLQLLPPALRQRLSVPAAAVVI